MCKKTRKMLTSSSSTKANMTTSESKSEKDIIFIILHKIVRSLNSSERIDSRKCKDAGGMPCQSVKRGQ